MGPSSLSHGTARIADCSYTSLTTIPSGLPEDITQFDLTACGLTSINASPLAAYPELEVLILNQNKLTSLTDDSFPSQSRIRVLSMYGNKLKTLTPRSLKNVPYLVKATGLEAYSFEAGIFEKLPRLKEASIFSLGKLPADLLSSVSLQSLHLHLPTSKTISPVIFGNSTKTLNELSIVSDALEYLPSNLLLEMTSLRTFSIVASSMEQLPAKFFGKHEGSPLIPGESYCYITDILIMGVRRITDDLFCKEPNVHRLKIYGSEEIQSGAFRSLERLHTLDLSHNHLKAINPVWLEHITGLKDLLLAFNDLTMVNKDTLSGLRMLERLDLSHNKLTHVASNTFDNVHNTLVMLNMSNNQIQQIFDDTFNEMFTLKDLDLGHNRLTSLPQEIFSHLHTVTHMKLDNNDLDSFPDDTFLELVSLNFLNLSSNALSTLPNEAFQPLPALKTLDLSENQIRTLPPYVVGDDSVLESVYLVQKAGVKFVCDCSLFPLHKSGSEWPVVITGECSSPAHVKGKNVKNVNFAEICNDKQLKTYIKVNPTKTGRPYRRYPKTRLAENDENPADIGFFASSHLAKTLTVVLIACITPVVVFGVWMFVHSMRGILYGHCYYVNYDVESRRI